MNANASISACAAPFTTALAAFSPGATTASASAISSALDNLCAPNAFSGCPQSTITAQLSAFYTACTNELVTSPNLVVKLNYDALYASVPLRQVICAKDDSGNYCAANLTDSSTTGSTASTNPSSKQSVLQSSLYTTPSTDGATSNGSSVLVPNATTYQQTNVLFMLLDPSMSSNQLCTTCTKNIMTPYISFESTIPYAPGLNASCLFSGQVALYNQINAICPAGFLNGAVQAAGGLSKGLATNAASRVDGHELSAAVSAILGVVALVAASL